jgi:peptide/nickel transport system substrate-binding protein
MKKYFTVSSVALLVLLGACSGEPSEEQSKSQFKEGKGGRMYGGVFRMNESEYIKTLFPPAITDAFSYRIAAQVYEGLFKFNQADLSLKPGLAESYTVSEDGTEYTILLKKGVFFHDDACFEGGKGRELNAADIKYCFDMLCVQSVNNQSFYLFKDIVVGANECFNASAGGTLPAGGVNGVQVVDDYTVKIKLLKPYSIFKYNLARPGAFIYAKEAYEKYGLEMREKVVGTGPFYVESIDDDIAIILKKNLTYHELDEFGNQLPYLDALKISFIKDKKTEYLEFKKGSLDMIYRLPTDYIIEIIEEANEAKKKGVNINYQLQRKPEMTTHFLSFNTKDQVFSDINVRKALSFAIDREKILEFVLNGEGYAPGFQGITPPVLSDYTTEDIKGYSKNIDSAFYYLAKAGFPKGKGFPKVTLDLNADGERNTNVAVEVQKQLKDNLGIDIQLNVLPLAQHVENSMSGKSSFFRLAWVADYPSAENFLWVFFGEQVPAGNESKSYPNVMRYTSKMFDTYYKNALSAITAEEANSNFKAAERVMVHDCPIIVLWYDEGYRLLRSEVKNFPSNPMQYRDFSEVYLSSSETKAAVPN